MATFENYFIGNPKLSYEAMNPYYKLCDRIDVVEKILNAFHLTDRHAHIINGHVPVKSKEGESPTRAEGRLFVIDGGIAKSYQDKTGIAGYTLIFNSHHIALAEHKDFNGLTNELETYSPHVETVDRYEHRVLIGDTDEGHEYAALIESLHDLIDAYMRGEMKETLVDPID